MSTLLTALLIFGGVALGCVAAIGFVALLAISFVWSACGYDR